MRAFLLLNATERADAMKSITQIHLLNYIHVNDTSLSAISASLTRECPLRSFKLNHGNITKTGLDLFVYKARKELRSFESLNLDHCNLKGASDFDFGENPLKELSLKMCCLDSSSLQTIVLAVMKKNNILTDLDLSGNDLGHDLPFFLSIAICNNRSLERLKLVSCDIDDEGAMSIVRAAANHHPAMKHLNFIYNRISNTTVRYCLEECYKGSNYNLSGLFFSLPTAFDHVVVHPPRFIMHPPHIATFTETYGETYGEFMHIQTPSGMNSTMFYGSSGSPNMAHEVRRVMSFRGELGYGESESTDNRPSDKWHFPNQPFLQPYVCAYMEEYSKYLMEGMLMYHTPLVNPYPQHIDSGSNRWSEQEITVNDFAELYSRKETFIGLKGGSSHCKMAHLPILLAGIPKKLIGVTYEVIRNNVFSY